MKTDIAVRDDARPEWTIIARANARQLGLKRYFTGSACVRGHVAERFVANSSCVECAAVHYDRWQAANPAGPKEIAARYRARHGSSRVAAWKVQNAELVMVSRQKGAQKDVARTDRWRRLNPEKFKAHALEAAHRRRARMLSCAVGSVTRADIERLMRQQKGRCWWCSAKLAKFHRDHRFPLSKRGPHSPGNIVLSCPTCNLRKGAKMPWQFAGRLL